MTGQLYHIYEGTIFTLFYLCAFQHSSEYDLDILSSLDGVRYVQCSNLTIVSFLAKELLMVF